MKAALAESRATLQELSMIEARPLIVRLRNFVGDTVLSLPALRLLEQHGYRLELVGKGWARGLLEAEGWPLHVRPAALRERVAQLRALRRRLREEDRGFDQRSNALLFPYAFSAALDARLAGLKAEGHAGDGRTWLMRRGHPRRAGRHALVEYWELACDFLGIEAQPPADIHMAVSEAQREQARALLAARGVEAGRFVLIFPEFVRGLKAAGRQAVIVPGPAEVQGAKELYPEAIRLDGVALGVYNAVLQQAGIVVANDTGPAHMAAGVGAKLVSVLGPTDPDRWAPWGSTVTVMRRWPEWPGAEEVISAVDQALP
jgi:heptosyltransferase-2